MWYKALFMMCMVCMTDLAAAEPTTQGIAIVVKEVEFKLFNETDLNRTVALDIPRQYVTMYVRTVNPHHVNIIKLREITYPKAVSFEHRYQDIPEKHNGHGYITAIRQTTLAPQWSAFSATASLVIPDQRTTNVIFYPATSATHVVSATSAVFGNVVKLTGSGWSYRVRSEQDQWILSYPQSQGNVSLQVALISERTGEITPMIRGAATVRAGWIEQVLTFQRPAADCFISLTIEETEQILHVPFNVPAIDFPAMFWPENATPAIPIQIPSLPR